MMKFFCKCTLIAQLILLSSCGLLDGPKYERPEIPVKKSWTSAQENLSVDEVIRPDWWKEFEDDFLNQLVSKAIESNLNLQIMSSRIKSAGIQVGLEKASLLPKITSSANTAFNTGSAGTQDPQHNLGVALSWELDIWGKLQKGVDAQKADYRSTEAIWRGAYLLLVSDVSNKYFEIHKFDQQISASEKSLDLTRQIANIYREQLTEGLIAEIKLIKQEAEINSKQKELIELQRQRKTAVNELAILLGYPAGEFDVPVNSRSIITIPDVPAGLPADLVSRRPDIIAAEYLVLKAHLLVGKAQLARLPTISMTSQGGLVNDLISGALKSYTFGLGPTINIPIFDPSLSKQIDSSKENQKAAILEYKNKVLRAYADVENELINLHSHKAQKQQLEAQLQRLTIVKDQVFAKLKEGMVSQLEVLEAERSLISNQLSLLDMHQQLLKDTVKLYKALGGGWPVHVVEITDKTEINED